MPTLKQTTSHEKHPEIDIISSKMSNLLDNFPLRKSVMIIHSIFNHPCVKPPPGSHRNCQGAKLQGEGGVVAHHLEIKSAMDPWKVSRPNDKLCLGGVLRPALGFDSEPFKVDSAKVERLFWLGRIRFLLENQQKNATLKIVFFSLFYIKKNDQNSAKMISDH